MDCNAAAPVQSSAFVLILAWQSRNARSILAGSPRTGAANHANVTLPCGMPD
jgi:hypothetical protein